MPSLYISAAHKSSGKTTLSIGLVRALRDRGLGIQPYKKGPDYIDPLWLSAAAGRPCYNLDFYTQSRQEIDRLYTRHLQSAQLGLIEGNKGLYDGLALDGSNSNAALAAQLQVPVVLVINTKGITRGIAPLLLGYQAFDRAVHIAGVILNQVGGARHERKLIEVVEHYTDLKILGAVPSSPAMNIDERHLGLIPSNEQNHAEAKIKSLAQMVRDQLDLDALLEIAAEAAEPSTPLTPQPAVRPYSGLRIGLPQDQAFAFYYPDDLERMQELGAELVTFNSLSDRQLPEVDGLFLGGGFPETAMSELAANRPMLEAVAAFIEGGGPVYAECGGLIYLTRSLAWGEKKCKMAGIIAADAVMHAKPQGRGYVQLQVTDQAPWEMAPGQSICAHEFHYSALRGLDPQAARFAYRVVRGTGIDGEHDGLTYKNLLASYSHRRNVDASPWVEKFLAKVAGCRRNRE